MSTPTKEGYLEFEVEELVKSRWRFLVCHPDGTGTVTATAEHMRLGGWEPISACRKMSEEVGDLQRQLQNANAEVARLRGELSSTKTQLAAMDEATKAFRELVPEVQSKWNRTRAHLEDENFRLKEFQKAWQSARKLAGWMYMDAGSPSCPRKVFDFCTVRPENPGFVRVVVVFEPPASLHSSAPPAHAPPEPSKTNEELVAEAKKELLAKLVPGSWWVSLASSLGATLARIVSINDEHDVVRYKNVAIGEDGNCGVDWFLRHYEPEDAPLAGPPDPSMNVDVDKDVSRG